MAKKLVNADTLRGQLRAMLKSKNQKDLAARLDIHPSYLCDVLKGRREISERLARAMGYRRAVMFEKEA